ncbi:substrate-binding periplasmic protein [Roseibium denhamense]|uniref:substrate-binding periplasmic protein n=1 Tax=Roseibium denhamense TaxID=76305 RepID=UPI0012BB62A2|nr:transporter substrate-binding domain-containing protein [Roseibium denhamense]
MTALDLRSLSGAAIGFSARIRAVACLLLFAALPLNAPAVQAENIIPDFNLLTEDWKPYHYVEDGKVKGQTVDLLLGILEEIGSSQGREDIVFLPWARAYRQAQTEPNTILFSTGRTENREKLFKWAGPILKFDSYFIGKKKRNFSIETSEDLHQYKVGVVIDGASAALAKRHGIPQENTTFNSEGVLNVKMLAADRIDFIPIQWKNFERLAIEAGIDPLQFEPVFLANTISLNFAFHLDTPDWVVREFQTALDDVLARPGHDDGSSPSDLN